MTVERHDRWRELVAVSLIGQLDERGSTDLRRHLEGCPSCRADVAELAPAAALLPLADPDRLEERPHPGVAVGQRILDQVRAERRRRRRAGWLRRSGAALLAAGLAVALWFAVLAPGPPPPQVPREPVAFTLMSDGVDASATLIAHTWGTEVNLVATGLTPGTRYTVVLVGQNGRRVTAGTFIGVSRQPVSCNLNAALLRTDAAELLVTDPRRRQVLRADLT